MTKFLYIFIIIAIIFSTSNSFLQKSNALYSLGLSNKNVKNYNCVPITLKCKTTLNLNKQENFGKEQELSGLSAWLSLNTRVSFNAT